MAASPRYRCPAIEAFRRQVRFARADVLERQALAAENLVLEITRDRVYPGAWILWRISGFTTEEAEFSDSILDGEDLRHDLPIFVLDLAADINFRSSDRPGGALTTAEVAQEIGVSLRTVQRWRSRGLPIIPIRFEDGRRLRGCYRESMNRFLALEPDLVEHAKSFARVGKREQAHLQSALDARIAAGHSPTGAEASVADTLGRSRGAVRRATGKSSLTRMKPKRARRYILRAHDQRIPMDRVANYVGRSVSTVYRLLNESRGERCRHIPLSTIDMRTAHLPDADHVFAAAGVLDDVPEQLVGLDPLKWMQKVREIGALEENDVAASRVAAMHFVHARARSGIDSLPRICGGKAVDAIERDLCWGGLLLERSIIGVMGEAVRRFDQSVGTRFDLLAPSERVQAVRLLLRTCGEAIVGFDPTSTSRWHALERSVGLGVAKAVAKDAYWRLGDERVSFEDFAESDNAVDVLSVLSVQLRSIMSPVRWWRRRLHDHMPSGGYELLMLRHGLGEGRRPRSMGELGRAVGQPLTQCVGPLAESERHLRASMR